MLKNKSNTLMSGPFKMNGFLLQCYTADIILKTRLYADWYLCIVSHKGPKSALLINHIIKFFIKTR